MAVDCKNARVVDRQHIADMSAEDAWDLIVKAIDEKDIDDVKEGVQMYIKAQPDVTYDELEVAFRQQGVGIYLIAIEKPAMLGALTNMDLQGNLGKKYTVTYRFSDKVALARPREKALWPKSPEENVERLKDAGEATNRGLIKCANCEEYGHVARECPQDKMEKERLVIKCFNCGEEGHRVRDCK
jgi:ribosomal protein L32